MTRGRVVALLRAAGCVFAEDEADVLIGAARDDDALASMVARRSGGEPLEQVVGFADFCGVRVGLRPGVFVPRVRSELLVRLGSAELRPGALVVDLCCGSGALGLAVRLRAPDITLHAADLDPVAVACAADNLAGSGRVHQGDLFEALPAGLCGRIDLLLANVPYVATRDLPFLPAEARDHEPLSALDGGDDGLSVFRAVAAGAARWLAPGGVLISEITAAQTAAAMTAIDGTGLTAAIATDDDLDARAIVARRQR